jgi:hypothetical protein
MAPVDALKLLEQVRAEQAERARRGANGDTTTPDWPEPKPLPSGLPPVEPFNSEFLPVALAPWVNDISARLQCPPDYVAVAAIWAYRCRGHATPRRRGKGIRESLRPRPSDGLRSACDLKPDIASKISGPSLRSYRALCGSLRLR